MKLTREDVENCRDIHGEMIKQAFRIVTELESLDSGTYDYFEGIDSLKFKETSVIIDGYDNYDDKAHAIIPIQYFYEDDWYEQEEESVRLKEIERELNRERMKESVLGWRERIERKEYERLKEKFEGNGQ